jgi:hypothetical protein
VKVRTETEAPLRVAPSQMTMGYHNRGVCRGGGSGRGRRQGGEGSPERRADVRALGRPQGCYGVVFFGR